MKTLFFYLIFICAQVTNAQIIRGFAGLAAYLDKSFDQSGFASVNTGIDINYLNNIKPEFEIKYYLASVPNQSTIINNEETAFLTRTVTAVNFSFCPKILFGDSEESTKIQILPIFNLTKVNAKGTLFNLSDSKKDYIKTESYYYSELRKSIGIGLGIIVNVSKDKTQSIAFNIYYDNVDIGNAINKLRGTGNQFHTQQSFGIGLKYYFGFLKNKYKNEK